MTILQKAGLIFLLLSWCNPVTAQKELNPYKYIIVPKKFDFLKEENQYRVNSYVKHLFVQKGYEAYYQGDTYPDDLEANPCLAVTADVLDQSNAFTTKLVVQLKNCAGAAVFETVQGISKIKFYDKSYRDALQKCFVSVQRLKYVSEPNASSTSVAATVPVAGPVEKPKAAVPVAAVAVAQDNTAADKPVAAPQSTEPVKTEIKPEAAAVPEVVVAAPVVLATKPAEAPTKDLTKDAPDPVIAKSYENESLAFMLINQGAQLQAYVTKSSTDQYKQGELIGTFEKTSLPNVFMVSWKMPEKDTDQTTAYFDDAGNLKIDVHRNGKLEVITFTESGK